MAEPKRTGGLPEVDIPYATAATRYGPAVAAVLDKLANSVANRAKQQPAPKFSWALAYQQADDPDTRDPTKFVAHLVRNSKVFLVARGFKWYGDTLLADIPSQIQRRFEERARLICSIPAVAEPSEAPEAAFAVGGEEPGGIDPVLTSLNNWLASHPEVRPGMAALARDMIRQLGVIVANTIQR